ncbi:hypothetical protein SUGI_0669800, partial [Cryptomeria japonica]
VPVNMPLYDILNEFQKGHSHMAVVVRYTGGKEQEQKMTKDGSNQVFMQTTHAHDNGKDVNINVDKSPIQTVQEKSFSNRRSLNKLKSFPATHASDSNRGMPKAKRWSRSSCRKRSLMRLIFGTLSTNKKRSLMRLISKCCMSLPFSREIIVLKFALDQRLKF